MSKNISIKEDNQSRIFTSKKLKIATQSGGFSLWIPEDEVKLKTLSIRKPGIYQAWVDEAYGYSKVNVSGLRKESDTKLIEKSVTENGTYKAEDDNVYAYKTITVNVAGGGGTAPPSYAPGSSVHGIYPDGTETTVYVDDEGKLKKAGLADHILLDTPPTKMKYRDGERILLGGAVVRGYLANGTPYKNASYQDSILPLYQGGDQESGSDDYLPGGVVFPTPLHAKYEGGDSSASIDDTTDIAEFWVNNMPINYMIGMDNITKLDTVWSTGGYYGGKKDGDLPITNVVSTSPIYVMGFLTYNLSYLEDSYYVCCASLEPFSYDHYTHNKYGVYGGRSDAAQLTINSKTFYYSLIASKSIYGNETHLETYLPLQRLSESTGYQDCKYAAYIVLFGKGAGNNKQTITLTWPREGDRKFLTTTYEIEVTP